MLRLVAALASLSAAAAQAEDACEARAALAGRIMALRQTEAPPAAFDRLVAGSADRLLAADLVARAYGEEVGGDADAREAASYHFAAEVYEGCRRGEALTRFAAA